MSSKDDIYICSEPYEDVIKRVLIVKDYMPDESDYAQPVLSQINSDANPKSAVLDEMIPIIQLICRNIGLYKELVEKTANIALKASLELQAFDKEKAICLDKAVQIMGGRENGK